MLILTSRFKQLVFNCIFWKTLQNISPRWIVYLLSGTYWRIWGHPQNAVHCYRHSLARVPQEYKHVVLTNLAGLLFSTETIDDALTVMQDSIELDPKDPDSNFFIANLYVIKVISYQYNWEKIFFFKNNIISKDLKFI